MGVFFISVVWVLVMVIIIVFELMGNFNVVFFLMVVCVMFYLVVESFFFCFLYDYLLEIKGIFLVEEKLDYDFFVDI